MVVAEKTEIRRYHVVTVSMGERSYVSANDFLDNIIEYSRLGENIEQRQVEAFRRYLAQLKRDMDAGKALPDAPLEEQPPQLFRKFEGEFARKSIGIKLRDRQIRHSYQDVLFPASETGLPFD